MSVLAVQDAGRARWALPMARWSVLGMVVGAGVSPPLLHAALLLLLVGFFALPDVRSRLASLRRQPVFVGWNVLFAALLLAALLGLAQGVPAARVADGLLGWRMLLFIPIVLALFDEPRAQRHLAIGVVIFAVLGALGSLVALAVGYSKIGIFPGIVLRNQVTQAMIFAAGALIALALAALDRGVSQRGRLALAGTGGLLLVMLVFMQAGRSGFVAFVVAAGTVVLVSLRGRMRLGALVLLPVLVATAFAASPRLQERFALGVKELRTVPNLQEVTSMGIRTVIWDTTGDLIEARPIMGYGLGGFAPAYATRIAQKYSEGWRATPVTDPHNQYLFLWTEAGVLGVLSFLVFLWSLWRQRPPTPYGAVGIGLVMGWCATSMFSSHFQTFNEGHLIALFIGVFLARERVGLLQPASAIARAAPSTTA